MFECGGIRPALLHLEYEEEKGYGGRQFLPAKSWVSLPYNVMNRKRQVFFNFPRGNKKGLSPLVATLLLVVFALVIGTATMNWGKAYVDKIGEEPEKKISASIVIDISSLDDDLKLLQIRYISGDITKEQYLEEEAKLVND